MYQRVFVAMMVCWGATQPARATAIFTNKPADQPVFSDYDPEPKQVKELAAGPGRVFATEIWWSGGHTYRTVYFRGDPTALNKALDLYDSMRDAHGHKDRADIVLRDDDAPEAREAVRWHTEDGVTLPQFDWSIEIGSHVKLDYPDRGKLSVDVVMDICVSDRIPLEALKIPPHLRVAAVSRLERFANLHESDRTGSEATMLKERIASLERKLRSLENRTPTSQPEGQAAASRPS